MEQIRQLLASVDFDSATFIKAALILAVGSILLGAVSRFIFGKHSTLNHAVSSAIGIVFVYAATVVLYSAGVQYQVFVAPLPFVTFTGDKMVLFAFLNADYTAICSQVLSMIILAFLANLVEALLPRGNRLLSWFFFRVLTVVLAIAAHLVVTWLFTRYLPQGLVTYAPTILLALLVILLLVGALKFIVGALLSTVHPLIGAFYTFFFATLVGKALTKAMLTTAIISGIVLALNYVGCTAVSIASAALIAYIPLLVVLLVIWYVVNKIF